ncbi:MAG: hypothetical protein GKR87_14645 [Kiritimatiellae bacterium]|nr:hypothetical protein [Kiritimatiellia bacterium]
MKTKMMIGFSVAMITCLSLVSFGDDDDYEDREEMSEAQIYAFLQIHLPEATSELKKLRKEDPEAYAEKIENFGQEIEYYNELKKESPEVAEKILETVRLEIKSWHVAQKVNEAKTPAKRKEHMTQLEKMLNKIFDFHLAEGEFEVQQVEKELREIRAMLEKRKASRERVIKSESKK